MEWSVKEQLKNRQFARCFRILIFAAKHQCVWLGLLHHHHRSAADQQRQQHGPNQSNGKSVTWRGRSERVFPRQSGNRTTNGSEWNGTSINRLRRRPRAVKNVFDKSTSPPL